MGESASFVPSLVALSLPFAAAVLLTAVRPHIRLDAARSGRFLIVVSLTIMAQALHFLEELHTGLFVRLPETFGYPPIAESVFVWFNSIWLAIWAGAVIAVRAGLVIALLPLWFLALAMLLNLLAHPLLALRAGGYFPGLITAPLVGVLGALTLRELLRTTAPRNNNPLAQDG